MMRMIGIVLIVISYRMMQFGYRMCKYSRLLTEAEEEEIKAGLRDLKRLKELARHEGNLHRQRSRTEMSAESGISEWPECRPCARRQDNMQR